MRPRGTSAAAAQLGYRPVAFIAMKCVVVYCGGRERGFSIPAPRIAARVTARTERERSVGRPEHALVVFRNGRGYTHHTRHHRRATKLRTALAVRCYSLILV